MPSEQAARRAPAPARRCAYAVIRRVFEHGAYADRALAGEAKGLDARDRALAMRLAYGAIQRRGTLDHVIGQLSSRPAERLDAPLAAALRLGMYELLYLSGAPDRAVVADAVELAKSGSRVGHGLVNAVLRRAAREGAQKLVGGLDDDTPEHAAVAHSHPEWVARMWWEQLGAATARALMVAGNEPGEVALRVNTLRAGVQAVAGSLGAPVHGDPLLPEALVLDGPLDAHGSEQWAKGQVIGQSRAAMLVSRVLDPQPGERVLDLCAAPGGKSTHLAALMQGEGEVVAVERNPKRASELRETAERLGAAGTVRVQVADAACERPEGAVFDRVLVDPPCSGLGTLQARPDLRWRVQEQDVAQLAGIQRQILGAGAHALRPGGVLVYSTCTISAQENELQVERFLQANPGFALEDVQASPGVALEGLASGLAGYAHPRAPGMLLTLPHRDRTAGFFIAKLRRS